MSPTLTRGFNDIESIIAKTMEYLSIPSVVGFEHFFMHFLQNDFEKLGLQAVEYPGLLEVRGSDPNAAIICAHIDRHGLVSLGDGEYAYAAQYIREIKYGEPHKSSQKELKAIAKRFKDERVFAYHPETNARLGEGTISVCETCIDEGDSIFYVNNIEKLDADIPVAYARTARAENNQIRGQIDNTLSIGVVYALFKAGFQGTAYLTTEEEIGKSWVHISNHLESENIETKDLIVIDTSPYLDHSPLREGTVIFRNRDRFSIFNSNLTERFVNRCEKLGIPYQIKDIDLMAAGKEIEELGSTELGRLISERDARWSGTTVQVPTTMYHTSNETTTRRAIRNYFRFLKNILIDDPIDFKIKAADKMPA
ncbi:MAG: hypothetical protein KDJ35_09140 [Alphaproteobacteria bacterium]|nr:hypothetical protein [Alphaproteobacteria bacterium]